MEEEEGKDGEGEEADAAKAEPEAEPELQHSGNGITAAVETEEQHHQEEVDRHPADAIAPAEPGGFPIAAFHPPGKRLSFFRKEIA